MNYFPDGCQNPSVITPGQFLRAAQGFIIRQGHTNYTLDCSPIAVPVPTELTTVLTVMGVPVLSWTDNATGSVNDMGYLIERSTTNSPTSWVTFRGFATDVDATTFSDDSDLIIGTTYFYRIKATNGDCNNYSNVSSVTYLGPYCPANGNSCDQSVDSVVVGTIDNATNDCNSGNGYSDHTDVSTEMFIGIGYPIEVFSSENNSGDRVGVWVDWNRDFDFDDSGENITINDPGTSPYTGVINPPVGATVGPTIMRIRIHSIEEATTEPCGTNDWGEVEDYTINVRSFCGIDAISAGPQSSCVPATNNYTQQVTVSYSNQPNSGVLLVNSQAFGITGSPQTVILTDLTADGADVDVTALFSEDGSCLKAETGLFTAPESCDVSGLFTLGDASLENLMVYSIGNEIVIDLTNADLEGSTQIEMYNLLGQVMVKKELNNSVVNTLFCSEATSGYYVVKVTNGVNTSTFKVILNK